MHTFALVNFISNNENYIEIHSTVLEFIAHKKKRLHFIYYVDILMYQLILSDIIYIIYYYLL
jgi:hypothetical protein